MATDGLRPEAEGALRRTAAAGVKRDVRMLQVAVEIIFNLHVALVNVGHPRQRVHVVNQIALGVVDDFAILVLVRQTDDGRKLTAFRHFLAGVIKFLAPDPVDRPRRLQGFLRQHHRVRANEADFGFGLLLLDGLGHLAIVFERGRGRVDNDVIEILCLGQTLGHTDVVGRAVHQLGIGRQRGGLRQPRREPIAGDLAAGLVTRTSTTVKAFVARGRKIKCSAHNNFEFSAGAKKSFFDYERNLLASFTPANLSVLLQKSRSS